MKKSTLSYTGNLRIDRRTLIAVTILLGTFIGHQAYSAESSIDFMCKSQAKEIAAQTYKSCVVESKQMEIERIRTEYKEKLEALKQQYSSELNSLSNKKAENEAAPVQAVPQSKQAEPEQPKIELKKKTTKSSITSTKPASKSSAKNNKLSKKSTSTSKVTANKEITEELIAAPYEEEDVKRQSAEPKIKSESIDLGSTYSEDQTSGDAMELSITRVNNPEIVELPYQEE